ncbi:MAG: O-antigen ligase family protein [Bacteroidota bacterium]|nr:O-antigen ligase family protein [Bacteroidota bacterium]
MKKIINIISHFNEYVANKGINPVNVFFRLFLVLFLVDSAINYFTHVPVFVIGAIIIFPVFFFMSLINNPDKKQMLAFILAFIIISIFNNIVHPFHEKNISDLLFVFLFFAAYFYYRENINKLIVANVWLFLLASLFMFSFAFINIQSDPLAKKDRVHKYKHSPTAIKWKKNKLDKIEAPRNYNAGIFRYSHIASYFFGFLMIFFLNKYWKKNKIVSVAIIIVSFALLFYTGSRAMIFAVFLSSILFLIRRKYYVYLLPIAAIIGAGVIWVDYFLSISGGSIFYQFVALIKTGTENFTRLSRYRIWYSWWVEVQDFGFLDFLIGRTNYSGILANKANLNYEIWFHNDFLNIFYSYGILGLLLYVWFFVRIFIDNRSFITGNFFIFTFFVAMLITAIINGFYFYFPIFLLYLFFLMIKEEKHII